MSQQAFYETVQRQEEFEQYSLLDKVQHEYWKQYFDEMNKIIVMEGKNEKRKQS